MEPGTKKLSKKQRSCPPHSLSARGSMVPLLPYLRGSAPSAPSSTAGGRVTARIAAAHSAHSVLRDGHRQGGRGFARLRHGSSAPDTCLENTAERTNGRRSRSQAPGNKESAGHAAHVQAGRRRLPAPASDRVIGGAPPAAGTRRDFCKLINWTFNSVFSCTVYSVYVSNY